MVRKGSSVRVRHWAFDPRRRAFPCAGGPFECHAPHRGEVTVGGCRLYPPQLRGMAFGGGAIVVWGRLEGTSGGEWLGVPPTGRSFSVPFANVAPFKDGRMEGEAIYFDLATLCEQTGVSLERVREATKARRADGFSAESHPRPEAGDELLDARD